ncbi:hypothetical protein ACJMK2_010229 [Sinanodonta woodiana]|uniref:Zinc finger PHD-type domain-containing protein n=1 Tax=Sinanodonta woodiana TaxID=1069815 RepID=A0ABD3VEN9_SINWO
MLDTLIQYESDLMETSEDKISMTDIQRKQNIRSGLCCVSDKAFHFFQELDKVIRKLETVEKVNLYGESFYDFITSRVLLNETLNQLWSHIFNTEDDEYFAVHVHKLKEEIVSKYLLMSSAQFRREFKQKKIQMRRDSKVKSSSEAQVSSSSKQSQLSKDISDYSSTSEQQESLHKLGKWKRSKTTKWPCGRCQEDCVVDSVCCDMCDTWHRYECIGLLGDKRELQKEEWTCPDRRFSGDVIK